MEGENDLGLIERLEPEAEHGELDRERRDRQEIVAGEGGTGGIEQIGPSSSAASVRRTGRPSPA